MKHLLIFTVFMMLTSILGCKPQNTPQPDASHQALAKKTSPQATNFGVEGAIAVVRNYYNAIARKDYRQAYSYWDNNGLASTQSFDEFKQGFAKTSSVKVKIEKPDRIEGAAGSRYIEIPVTITATTTEGKVQNFVGKYTLRRTVVDGATPDRQKWHIYSADISTAE